ncbi:MAG TPA: acyltransferase [Solirubrobacteraceae bacterium]|nr:acyltransferase [Solirubrobacteraceae bacterium]
MATTVEAAPSTDLGIRTLIAGDGVRGVGALFVFTTHVCLLADPVPDNNLLSYGWAAPILGHIDLALSAFFVLSGYLIARPFTRAYITGGRRPAIRSYVRNRVLRVVPVFYFFTILVLLRFGLDGSLQTGAAAPDERSTWWQVIGQFLFIQGQVGGPASIPIGPAWSIGAEVGFYFVIPLAAYGAYVAGGRLRGQYARAGFALAAIGLVFVVSIALRAVDKYHFAWLTAPPAIMYGFMPGVALGIVEPLIAAPLRRRARLAKQLAWGAFALGLLCAIVYATSDYDPRQTPIHHALGVRAMLAAMCTGLLFFGLVVLQIGTGSAPRMFANKGMLWLGARSYSFYLVHIWVLLELDHLLGSGESLQTRLAIMAGIGFPLTVLSGALTYRYIELPFLQRKIRTTQHAPPEAVPPAAPEPAR